MVIEMNVMKRDREQVMLNFFFVGTVTLATECQKGADLSLGNTQPAYFI